MRRIIAVFLLALLFVTCFSSCGDDDKEFKISFMVDGEEYGSAVVNGSDAVAIPNAPTKDGFSFDGWYFDKDEWNKPLGADTVISADTSVYAKWKESETDIETDTEADTETDRDTDTPTEHEHIPAEAVVESFVDATCKKSGSYNSVVYCSICNEKLSSVKNTLEKKAHISSDWIEDVAPTCRSKGLEHKECTLCREELETRTLDKLTEHKAGEKKCELTKGSFCGDVGECYFVVNCKDCGKKLSEGYQTIPERHVVKGGACEACGLPESTTAGLKFTLNSDKKSYSVTDTASFSGGNVVIGVYNGLSVTHVNFGGCDRLKTIVLADCVEVIDGFTFCTNLMSVKIGNRVKEIPEYAFAECVNLSTITIGDGVEKIGADAFYGCKKLLYAYISDSHDWSVANTMFYGEWIGNGMEAYFADYLKQYSSFEWYRI